MENIPSQEPSAEIYWQGLLAKRQSELAAAEAKRAQITNPVLRFCRGFGLLFQRADVDELSFRVEAQARGEDITAYIDSTVVTPQL
jgi:hypothetical protein